MEERGWGEWEPLILTRKTTLFLKQRLIGSISLKKKREIFKRFALFMLFDLRGKLFILYTVFE